MPAPSWIQYSEEVVAEGHPTKADVANRPAKTIWTNFTQQHDINGLHLLNWTLPCVFVKSSVNQSIANGVNTTLSFDLEDYDTDNLHSTTTNNSRITISRAGLWLFFATVVFASNSTGFRTVYLGINGGGSIGVTRVTVNAVSGIETYVCAAGMKNLSVNDYVEVIVSQNSGAALNVLSGLAGINTHFGAIYIGRNN
jgi:hypothetical protein